MKTQSKMAVLLVFLLLLTGFACNENNELPDGPGKITIDDKSKELIEADNEFGLAMFAKISQTEKEENYMISPLSISLALGMAYNGAEGKTREEMEEVLGLSGLTRDEINKAYQTLVKVLLEVDPKVAMEIANSIWYRQGFNVKSSFLDINKIYYDAEVKEKDFNNLPTKTDINQWVSDKTHGKIPEIVQNISPQTVMYLINAIYFNGTWTKEFNTKSTRDWDFTREGSSAVKVDGMSRKDTVGYYSNDAFRSIVLPYGSGNYQMMLMLPNDGKTTGDIMKQLIPKNWVNWQNQLATNTKAVNIMLPRFEFSYEIKLNEVLQALGMQQAFSDMADFSSIVASKDIKISEVKHKTYIKTNEEGTEAAAVTSVEFTFTSIGPNEPVFEPFFCNKPFLFAIVEKDTGAIVFMGKVGNPGK